MQHLPTDPLGWGVVPKRRDWERNQQRKCADAVLIQRMLSELSQQTPRWPGQGNTMVSVKKKREEYLHRRAVWPCWGQVARWSLHLGAQPGRSRCPPWGSPGSGGRAPGCWTRTLPFRLRQICPALVFSASFCTKQTYSARESFHSLLQFPP